MKRGIATGLSPELSPRAGAEAFESFKEDFPDYNAEEVLTAFEEKLQGAACALIDTYNAIDAGQDERRRAVATYGALAMAKHSLLYEMSHDIFKPAPPAWLEFAQSDLKSRTEEDSPERTIVERTPIFSEDLHVQQALGDVVSASILPQGDYTSLELASGLVSGRVIVQPF